MDWLIEQSDVPVWRASWRPSRLPQLTAWLTVRLSYWLCNQWKSVFIKQPHPRPLCKRLIDSPAWQLPLFLQREAENWVLLALSTEDRYWFSTCLLFLFFTEKRQVSLASVLCMWLCVYASIPLCLMEMWWLKEGLLPVCWSLAYDWESMNVSSICTDTVAQTLPVFKVDSWPVNTTIQLFYASH